jgi:hypothetical protein
VVYMLTGAYMDQLRRECCEIASCTWHSCCTVVDQRQADLKDENRGGLREAMEACRMTSSQRAGKPKWRLSMTPRRGEQAVPSCPLILTLYLSLHRHTFRT